MSLISSIACDRPIALRTLTRQSIPNTKVGMDLLKDGRLSHGTGYSREERDRFHLRGLVPHKVFTINEHAERIRRQFNEMPTPLLKYIFLANEREKNEDAFWRFLFTQNPTETMPVLYTPTVGEACQKWSTFRASSRGLFICPEDRGHIKDILRNYPRQDIRCIVVTDGGRILGLGDLGASGLGIPVGKLMLYTLIGQVPPEYTLPVQLDMGTDNKALLEDPIYHGWRHPRIRGAEHTAFVEEFVNAVKEVYGETCLVQFEDFEMNTAFTLLDHFRWRCNCFNDDIEGTASVAAAALATATRIKGCAPMHEQKIAFIGAGSAATGIAHLIADMAVSTGKIKREDMLKNIIMFDKDGLVHAGRTDLPDINIPFAHKMDVYKTVAESISGFGVTTIIGVSGCPGLITKEIVQGMTKNVERPVVMALSNPTSKAECTPEQAYDWSNQKALVATGSPFPDYKKAGVHFVPAQANNSWIFPAVGLALVTTQARHCPPKVFQIAAEALAAQVKTSDLDQGALLPPLPKIRDYSLTIAIAVAKYLYDEGLATAKLPPGVSLEQFLKDSLYLPPSEYTNAE